MSGRYRYQADLVEVDIQACEGPAYAPTNWAVKDRITGVIQVLTDAEFRARFEPVPPDPSDKLCFTCRHRRLEPPTVEHSVCLAPKVAISLISGDVQHGHPCAVARSDAGLCGRFGIYWEPKS